MNLKILINRIPTKIYAKNILQQNLKNFSLILMITLKLKKWRQLLRKNSTGLLTGYYEPAIKAYNYAKEGSYPIYKHPNTVIDQVN